MAGRPLQKWEAMGSWAEDPGKQLKGGMPPHRWRSFHVRPPSPTALGLYPPPPHPVPALVPLSLSGSARLPHPRVRRSHTLSAAMSFLQGTHGQPPSGGHGTPGSQGGPGGRGDTPDHVFAGGSGGHSGANAQGGSWGQGGHRGPVNLGANPQVE